MDLMDLILAFHKTETRQGPGSTETTLLALDTIPNNHEIHNILDLGCGTGAQTIALAKNIQGHITAIDLHRAFLDELVKNAKIENVISKITPVLGDMDNLSLQPYIFDLIWSEGAIYNIGFENGLNKMRYFLKDGGYLAVSEITWLTENRPHEVENYWQRQYSEIAYIDDKLHTIESCGYQNISHFVLPKICWTKNYYLPLLRKSAAFLKQCDFSAEAKNLIKATIEEAEIYCKYSNYYSYVFYIMRKI